MADEASVEESDKPPAAPPRPRLPRRGSMWPGPAGALPAVAVLALVVGLQLVAVHTFTTGFLLRRTELPDVSQCASPPFGPPSPGATQHGGEAGAGEEPGAARCWWRSTGGLNPPHLDAHSVQYRRVVLLLVDALRHDFAVFNDSLAEQDARPYQNKLPTLKRLLETQPERTLLTRFMADPPTTTMQRLKGLTTGGLPTFLDAGSNFDSDAIVEDNWLAQLRTAGKRTIFMGDDTWENLFPNHFSESHPFPSFNVKDLHTVDQGVVANLFPYLAGERGPWDVLIGHFLGVDHCGHRYGPDHPAMAAKLQEMDGVIERVVQQLGDDTLLLLFGDHGMTVTGDHGGDSPREVTAALFAYGAQGLGTEAVPQVDQIDLAPTLSLLLDLPIPFGNLGRVILPLLGSGGHSQGDYRNAIHLLHINAAQINRYLETYASQAEDVPVEQLQLLRQRFLLLDAEVRAVDGTASLASLRALRSGLVDHIADAQALCRQTWATFDMTKMLAGIAVMAAMVVVQLGLVDWDLARDDAVALCCVAMLCGGVFSNSYVIHEDAMVMFLLASIILLLAYKALKATQQVAGAWRSLLPDAALALVCVRASSIFRSQPALLRRICREEQQPCPYRADIGVWVALASTGALFLLQWQWLASHRNLHGVGFLWARLVLPLVVLATSLHWATEQLEKGSAAATRDNLAANERRAAALWRLLSLDLTSDSAKVMWAQAVYGLALLTAAAVVARPLCYTRLRAAGQAASIRGGLSLYTSATVVLVMAVSAVVALLLGVGVGFSVLACFATASAVLNLHAWVVLGQAKQLEEAGKSSRSAMPKLLLSRGRTQLGRVYGPQDEESSPSGAPSPEHDLALNEGVVWRVRPAVALCWYLLGANWFYATGHQAAISSIHWASGLVGLRASHLVFSGLLVWLENFGPYTLAALAFPLLALWPLSRKLGPDRNPELAPAVGDFWFASQRQFVSRLCGQVHALGVLHAMRLLASMLAATLHRRHLMVWKVFAPRFVFDAVIFGSTSFGMALGLLFACRVHSAARGLLRQIQAGRP